MNRSVIDQSISIIKECEVLKEKIDQLNGIGIQLNEMPLNYKKEIVIRDMNTSVSGKKNSSASSVWSIRFSEDLQGEKINDSTESEFNYTSTVSESLLVISVLLGYNRDKLQKNIIKLKELGVKI